MRKALVALALLASVCMAQDEARDDVWQPLRPLLGSWEGTGQGSGGEAIVRYDFDFALGGRFLRMRTLARFAPREGDPEGEVHEDVGYIGYDRARGVFVFRQFHVEGYVNRYTLRIEEEGRALEFTSEALENAPEGMRARLEYALQGENRLTGSFHLAFPGREFSCMSTYSMRRVEEEAQAMESMTANLVVADVNRSVQFYRDVLGFELAMSVPEEGSLDWAMVTCGGVQLMLQSVTNIRGEHELFSNWEPGGSLVLFTVVSDVRALRRRVEGKAPVVFDLHETFYGMTEFSITDPDGYVLTFAQQAQQ